MKIYYTDYFRDVLQNFFAWSGENYKWIIGAFAFVFVVVGLCAFMFGDDKPIEIKPIKQEMDKIQELMKLYEILIYDYELLIKNKDQKMRGLLIFNIEEGKRLIKELKEK